MKKKAELAWGGYVNSVLHRFHTGAGCGPDVAVFRSRAGARLEYEDVRRIEIREVKPKRKAATR
jgi:hypothetical protein